VGGEVGGFNAALVMNALLQVRRVRGGEIQGGGGGRLLTTKKNRSTYANICKILPPLCLTDLHQHATAYHATCSVGKTEIRLFSNN
jgi:hypothetical protein